MIAARMRAQIVSVAAFATVACSALQKGTEVPHIDGVQPDSVMLAQGAVVQIIVRGNGFAPGSPGKNTIQFGDVKITDVPASDDGKEIRLVVPEHAPARGDAAPLPLEAGRYNVTVATANGMSNAVVVRVDR